IMVTAQCTALAAGTALVIAVHTGHVSLPLLYGIVLVVAATAAFDNPARVALLPTLVSRDILPRAVTVASTNQALAFASGPALAGILIGAFGIAAAYDAYLV